MNISEKGIEFIKKQQLKKEINELLEVIKKM